MKLGFMQVPILIAIILGLSIAGGGGYFIGQKINNHQKETAFLTSKATTATTTETHPSAPPIDSKSVKDDLVISSMQKQISDLTKKVEQKNSAPAIKTPGNTQQAEATSTPQITVNIFPCSKFGSLTEDIYGISLELINTYIDDGFNENPTKSNFDYPYNKVASQKTPFSSNIARLNQKIDLLDTYEGVSLAKSNLYQTANSLQGAFDLKLQGYKLVNNDALVSWGGSNVIPPDNIDQAKLDLTKAGTKFTVATDSLTKGKAALDNISKANNCN